MAEGIQLKVMEALQEEAYKGIIRIDSEAMRSIGVRQGDIVEIEGDRVTVGLVDRAYPSDVGQAIIRMDGIIRKNAKTAIGENVIVRKADVKEAKAITVAPAQKGVMVQAHPDLFKKGLLGRAVVKGDIVSLGGARRRTKVMSDTPNLEEIFNVFEENFSDFSLRGLKFVIADVLPKQAVLITDGTQVKLNPNAIDVVEESVPDVTYEDIGGLKESITKVREMVELPLRHPEIFRRLSISPPAGVLLHGPPGCGKTLLAKAVANESEAHFILINGPEIMNKYYGESEKRVRELFEEAEKHAPTIIFIDEIDAIAPKREEVHGEVERRVVSQLLTLMDGLKSRGRVVVIGATNRPNAIDPALRRPGRFDREISIGVPDVKGRYNILQIHTRNMPLRGKIHLDIFSEVLISKIDSKIKEIIDEKKKLNDEIILLRIKIKEAEKELKTNDETLIGRIKNSIQQNNKRVGELSEDLSKNEVLLKRVSNLSDLKYKKEIIESIYQEVKELDGLEIYRKSVDKNDPRIKFIESRKEDLGKELFDYTRELIELEILSEAMEEASQKGVTKDLNILAERTHGFVGADMSALVKEAAMNVLRRLLPEIKLRDKNPIPKEVLDKLVVTPIDFEEALRLVRPSALREVLIEKPNTTWEQIGGLESIKEEIKEAVEWPLKYSANFKRMGIKPPRGVLLYGPPGTGKTLLAKAVANGSEANFILVKGPELLNMFVGESEKGVRKIFEKARQAAPTIIFFDEIDSIAHKRGMEFGEKVTERMVNTLLSEMDGLQELNDVLVIAATNRPDMIDPALLRPGRFDRVILIPVPDEKSRLEILKVHTKGMPIAKDVNINELSKGTNNYTGADIEALCREAAILALRKDKNAKEVKMDNFKDALKKVKNSVDSEDMEKYKRIEEDYLKTARGAAIKEKLSYLG